MTLFLLLEAIDFWAEVKGTLFGLGGVFTVFLFLYNSSPARDFYYHRVKWRTTISRNDFNYINQVLLNNIPYYSGLSANGKAKFVNRLKFFLSTKRFVGKDGLQISDEIKILISAAGVQLTFGLEKYVIAHFHTFLVYPSIFYSKLLRKELKGAAFGGGVICLSWKDFQKGYDIPNDRYNLGLHEMAHALKVDALRGDDFDEKFAQYLDMWYEAGSGELLGMQDGNKSFLRPYGGRNEHEFFAVCVEYFFEVPQALKEKLPDIYKHLCILLNQDPMNVKQDYHFWRESIG